MRGGEEQARTPRGSVLIARTGSLRNVKAEANL